MRRLGVLILAGALLVTTGGVASSSPATRPAKDLVVGLQVVKGGRHQVLALVPVTINGQGPFTFALDTGAAQSLVDAQLAKRLHATKAGSAGKIAGINSVTKAALVKVRSWKVGTIALPPTTLVATNLPNGNAYVGLQGLLGSDMLSRFDVITIDYKHKQLRLQPRG
jgi:predicted aspartyl protease